MLCLPRHRSTSDRTHLSTGSQTNQELERGKTDLEMKTSRRTQWLVAMVAASIQPASAWFLQAGTPTLPRCRGSRTTTCKMAATPSSDHDDAVSASLTRGQWLKVGASLAAIAPVLALSKDDEALAVTSSGILRKCVVFTTYTNLRVDPIRRYGCFITSRT